MGRAMEVFDDVSDLVGESFGVLVFACVPYGRRFLNGKAQFSRSRCWLG